MNPPNPAAVKAALEIMSASLPTERHEMISEMAREKGTRPSVVVSVILTGHIHAVAQEMRAEANVSMIINGISAHSEALRHFADKLEGKQK